MPEDRRQPTRSTRVVKPRRFDKTQLRAIAHGRTPHRDYAAHVLRWNFLAREVLGPADQPEFRDYLNKVFFRWGWVARHVKLHMKILDVGCGQDQPLLYTLGSRKQTVPELYVGVDLNFIPRKSMVRWAKIYDNYDFVTNGQKLIDTHGPFDVVANFEVIEHMMPEDGQRMLALFRNALKPGGKLFLSTPVFNGAAAANHVHEYTILELDGLLKALGFKVIKRIGTFASQLDIENAMFNAKDTAGRDTYNRLKWWFGGDVMSTFMAPLYPNYSRNNLWICTPDEA